jgi:hypothetical protein
VLVSLFGVVASGDVVVLCHEGDLSGCMSNLFGEAKPLLSGGGDISLNDLHAGLQKLRAFAELRSAIDGLSSHTGAELAEQVKFLRAFLFAIHGSGGCKKSIAECKRLSKNQDPPKDLCIKICRSIGDHNLSRADILDLANCQLAPKCWIIPKSSPVAPSATSSKKKQKAKTGVAISDCNIQELCDADPFTPKFPTKVPASDLALNGKVISDVLAGSNAVTKSSYKARRFYLDENHVNAFRSMPVYKTYELFTESRGRDGVPTPPNYAESLARAIIFFLKKDESARKEWLDDKYDADLAAGLMPEELEFTAVTDFFLYLDRVFANAHLDLDESTLTQFFEGTLSGGSAFLPLGPIILIRFFSAAASGGSRQFGRVAQDTKGTKSGGGGKGVHAPTQKGNGKAGQHFGAEEIIANANGNVKSQSNVKVTPPPAAGTTMFGSNAMSAPSHIQSMTAGQAVVVQGLTESTHYNGSLGTITGYEEASRRYIVKIHNTDNSLKLKSDKLALMVGDATGASASASPSAVVHDAAASAGSGSKKKDSKSSDASGASPPIKGKKAPAAPADDAAPKKSQTATPVATPDVTPVAPPPVVGTVTSFDGRLLDMPEVKWGIRFLLLSVIVIWCAIFAKLLQFVMNVDLSKFSS